MRVFAWPRCTRSQPSRFERRISPSQKRCVSTDLSFEFDNLWRNPSQSPTHRRRSLQTRRPDWIFSYNWKRSAIPQRWSSEEERECKHWSYCTSTDARHCCPHTVSIEWYKWHSEQRTRSMPPRRTRRTSKVYLKRQSVMLSDFTFLPSHADAYPVHFLDQCPWRIQRWSDHNNPVLGKMSSVRASGRWIARNQRTNRDISSTKRYLPRWQLLLAIGRPCRMRQLNASGLNCWMWSLPRTWPTMEGPKRQDLLTGREMLFIVHHERFSDRSWSLEI